MVKKISKEMKKTQDIMQEIRTEDTIRLRKRIEELIDLANIDRKKIFETKKLREEQLNELEIQLIKNQSALEILKILTETK
jgi:hypothetical protein